MVIKISRFTTGIVFVAIPLTAIILPALTAFLILIFICLLNRNFEVLVFLFLCMILTLLIVFSFSPVSYNSDPRIFANALNTTFSFLIIIFSSFFKLKKIQLDRSPFLDFLVISLSVLTLLFIIIFQSSVDVGAIPQILAFSFAGYLSFAPNLFIVACILGATLIISARAILIGAIVGWIFSCLRSKLRAWLIGIVSTIILFIFLNYDVVQISIDLLSSLREIGVFFKGRVNWWLYTLAQGSSFMGNGPGFSVMFLSDLHLESSMILPHNDFIRVYSDYGIFGFFMLLISLILHSLKSSSNFFIVVLLSCFLLTGNPLSFPTVVITFLVIICGNETSSKGVAKSKSLYRDYINKRSAIEDYKKLTVK